jgi:hypothetical protein
MVLARHRAAVNEEMVSGRRPRPEQTRGALARKAERDVVCLGCSRCLARVADDGIRLRLRAPQGEHRPLLVATPRGARCQRCGGLPYLERE